MKVQETASGIERNALREESVLLRIHQLQNGLVQLTDATTAYRLVTKHGDDIRYIAPWKKWGVWNGAYWETDSGGALIHTRGLEIVRNIYGEIAKTADYRERIEIEKYAIKSESTRQRENFVRAARYIPECFMGSYIQLGACRTCKILRQIASKFYDFWAPSPHLPVFIRLKV